MNKQEIIDRVGREKYSAASSWFRADSASDDYGSNDRHPRPKPSDPSITELPLDREEALQILSQLQLAGRDLEDRPQVEEMLRKRD